MFIVKRRSELIRFGLFLLLAGAMAYYVAGRFGDWRVSEGSNGTLPTAQAVLPGEQGMSAIEAARLSPEGSDFFAEYRMNRERNRSALKETLKEVMDNQAVDSDTKKEASQQYLDLGRITSLEDQAETLVKAKGYEDVIVHLADGSAQVIVKGVRLSEDQYMQVVDMVARVTGVKAGSIQVFAKEV